ncbi:hypothetical protein CBR_g28886 [Chara braunii]|uniref:Integrase zinc-binding domain-containing protein n=1 Tax=Chara braunii TaxID=69332 RepID=A0A388LA37_CHABU|nr:hypothetical protein CBR_g28886 [Chara braunii]|eukprot:GBG79170.1 hypothetical protein CBR_g28886 [Chara braunii]
MRVSINEELSDSEYKELVEDVIGEQRLGALREVTTQGWMVYEVTLCVKGRVCLEIVRDETPTKARKKDGQRIEGEEVILSPRKRGARKLTMKSTLDDIDTVEPLRHALRQPMQCTILEYLAASRPARDELQMTTCKTCIPLGDEVHMASKPEVPSLAVSGVCAKAERAATVYLDGMEGVPPDKFYILGSRTVETILNDEIVLHGVIDNGSEAVIIEEELAVRLGMDLDRSYLFEIEAVDGRKQKIFGVCHKTVIEVEGLRVLMPVFTVRDCSSELLVGRTWLSHFHAVTIERPDRSQMLSINRPDGGRIMIETFEPRNARNKAALAAGGGRKPVTLVSCSLRFREKKYGALLTKEEGRIVEVEDLGNHVLVGENPYPKREDKEFEGSGMPLRVICDPEEKQSIVAELHDGVVGGHRGVKGTYEKVRKLYWWEGQYKDVEKHCMTCEEYKKKSFVRYKEPLHPSYLT